MIELGVIADDLTGGMKVASLLEREGVRCPLVTSGDALETLDDDVQAVVVGRKLLIQPADDARADAKHTAEALLAKKTKQLYYKYSALFSSTARGNIGPVAETLMDLTQADHVFFCPVWKNTTIYQGRLFLGSIMLHESPRRNDPVTPMTNSNLVEVLQEQSQVKVGLLPYQIMVSGIDACEQYISEQKALGVKFFIVDAIDESDLVRLATLSQDLPLSTGADLLPVMLARNWQGAKSQPRTILPPAPGLEAVISGSCTGKSVRQLAHFEQTHPVFRIDLLEAAKDANLVDRIVDWTKDRLENGPVAVGTTADPEGVKRAQSELGREGAATLADKVLSTISQHLYQLGVRKFVVAGGETSGAVMAALGIEQVAVATYDEVLFGGYCHRAGSNPLSLVLKAGGVGDDNFIHIALERMRTADAN